MLHVVWQMRDYSYPLMYSCAQVIHLWHTCHTPRKEQGGMLLPWLQNALLWYTSGQFCGDSAVDLSLNFFLLLKTSNFWLSCDFIILP